jgi:hypothetical protein
LETALPSLSAAERKWRFLFMAGSLVYALSLSRVIGEMTEGVCDPTDRSDVTARLVRFVAAGFRAAEPPQSAQPPSALQLGVA